jgi:hypothetical protein
MTVTLAPTMGVFWNPRTGTLWAVLADGTIASCVPASSLRTVADSDPWEYHMRMSSRDEAIRLLEGRELLRVR